MHILTSITLGLLSFKLTIIDSFTPNNLRSTNVVTRNAKIPTIKDIADDYWSSHGGCVNGAVTGQGLGASVSLSADGNLILISSITDVVLYSYDPDGWIEAQRFGSMLVDNGRGAYKAELARFGRFLIVGSPNNGAQGVDTGAAQTFINEDGLWSQIGATIVGDSAGDLFGFSVSIANLDNKVAIGAPGGSYARAYTFDGSRWVYSTDADLGGNIPGSGFGYSVAISANGDSTIVGAPDFVDSRGMARIYRLKTGEDTQQITGTIPGSSMGQAVALTGDGLVVAISEIGTGIVKVYRSNTLFNIWEQAGLDIIVEGEEFGFALAITGEGNSIAVGAPANTFNGINAGAGYVFDYDREYPDLTGTWVQRGLPFYAIDAGSRCGESISFSDDGEKVVTGCPSADYLVPDGGRLCVYSAPPEFAPSTVPSNVPSLPPSGSPTESPTKLPTTSPTAFPTLFIVVTEPANADSTTFSLTQVIAALLGMILTFFGGICAGGYFSGGLWYWCDGYYCCDWWYEPWFYHHSSYQQQ